MRKSEISGPNDVRCVDVHPAALTVDWQRYAEFLLYHEYLHALGLQVMPAHFEILRHCGLMKKREPWGNPSGITCERGLQNGCGLARSVPKNIREAGVGEAVIVVENVASHWSM